MSEFELNELRIITRRVMCRNGKIADASNDELVDRVINFFGNIAVGIMEVARENNLSAEESEELFEKSSEIMAERKIDILELLKGGK